tara:strand:- start:4353 stop:5033 length:681 start_codon:yes stop_codon:yes gene_type:complete
MALPTADQFLATTPIETNLLAVVISLFLSALLSFILSQIYVKYGTALSNRKHFASNFIILATTTTLIITIVKSSLALSLGLVGALSIVRFRAAIKEPEELSFLFIAIGIGLGFGAHQWAVTIISFVIISLILILRNIKRKKYNHHNLYLSITGKESKYLTLTNIIKVLTKHCNTVHLKRFDHTDGTLESSFLVDIGNHHHFALIKNDLDKLSSSVNLTYLDKDGIS